MRQASMKSIICLFSASVLWSGCDQLTATVQAVSVVTSLPSLAEAHGMDPTLLAAMPASSMPPEFTTVLVGVGERASITSTEPPQPVGEAQVSISFGASPVNLCGVAGTEGTFQASSIPSDECGNPALVYAAGEEYKTSIETSTDTYELSVTAPTPVNPDSVEFTPALGSLEGPQAALFDLAHHPKNTALNVDWSGDTEASKRNTLVTVVRINYDTTDDSWELDPENPIFDNTPKEAAAMIDLITQTPPTSVSLQASLFGTEGLYMVVVTSTELSTSTSSNLSLGSGALAGRGTAFVFYVN